MKKKPWFHLYPDHQLASRLSIAGGGVKLLSLFLLVAAILYSLVLALAGLRLFLAAGLGAGLIFLIDELDDTVFSVFFLWGAFAVCRFAVNVLQAKAELLARSQGQGCAASPEEAPAVAPESVQDPSHS